VRVNLENLKQWFSRIKAAEEIPQVSLTKQGRSAPEQRGLAVQIASAFNARRNSWWFASLR